MKKKLVNLNKYTHIQVFYLYYNKINSKIKLKNIFAYRFKKKKI